MGENLKKLTARSVKWNAIDRLSSQALYAVTGIVLARLLTPTDFGLVGAVLIFQAFASLLVDSGFSYALLQRKQPSRLDYSSVLWFNLGIATLLYVALYFCAPLIADCFQHDQRLIPLSRAMFLSMILNASAIVQVNQLTKRMHVRPIAVANIVSLSVGGALGIIMAVKGYGAWAIVGQALANSGVKSLWLWATSHWWPAMKMSWTALRGYFSVGSGMMMTSFLNTLFLNIFSFFIGNQSGMARLGYYTQADKWSKMGITSLSQTLTSSFIPPLSAVQDDPERFRRLCAKMNRATAYILFPAMIGLIIMATPIFHLLFGAKWDLSIALFQLLLTRGIFLVLSGLCVNYLLALGRSRAIFTLEVVRDGLALAALGATLPYLSLSTPTDAVAGIRIMVNAQILAAVIGWIVTLIFTCRATAASPWAFCRDYLPYLIITAVISPLLIYLGTLALHPIILLLLQSSSGALLYLLVNHLLHSRIQSDLLSYLRGRL
ncbi:MAG: lipopolysaccharide biosynthesis protein [Bacteroidales bacterium]|nr:lipopolysaccharide biosynthesis protein [Bacteroidales bacterium]